MLASLRTNFANATTNTNADDGNTDHAPATLTRPKVFPIAPLNDLVNRHFRATQSAPLAITGRHRELLYALVATLITPPHDKAVAIVDFEGRFDPLRLLATSPITADASPGPPLQRADLDHVHILRPARGSAAHMAECVVSAEGYMLYGAHSSRGREWWGTVVIGGGLHPAGRAGVASTQVAVTADWKGWLRVDRAEVPAFFWEVGVQKALADRERRRAAVEDAGWVASSPWGGFTFGRRG